MAVPSPKVNVVNASDAQWMPVLAVKPDGTQLFMAWYDRRNDPTNNSLIETWGSFTRLPLTNATNFSLNFPISTVQFPPVFSGTRTNTGTFDRAYPPWISDACVIPGWFRGLYRDHMGDYDTAVSDAENVRYTWADNRTSITVGSVTRNQADVRAVRLHWPQ